MKRLLLLLLLLFSCISYGQQRVTITMNDGKVVSGYGKITAKAVKYKTTKKGKYKKIAATEIDNIIVKRKRSKQEYAFRPLKEGKRPKLMELIYSSKGLQLFKLNLGGTGIGASKGGVSGGVKMKVIRYYVQRKGEKAVTMIRSGALMGKSFEKRAEAYFKDCPELISKLGTKGFKKGDLKNVMKYYNEHCGSKSVEEVSN